MNTLKSIMDKEDKLKYLHCKDYKVVCFGASLALDMTLDGLLKMQIKPDFICDNDKIKQNTYKRKYQIYSPDTVFKNKNKFLVIISSMYSQEIKKQLEEYENIIFCEDYRCALPAKIYKTDISVQTEQINQDTIIDNRVVFVQNHTKNAKFREYNYLNYLSYCNQIIAEDREENVLYLCKSKYNFTPENFKKILEYFLFRRYEEKSMSQIVIDSLVQFNQDYFKVLRKSIKNLSDEKFSTIEATQKMKKQKPHALVWHLYHIDMFEEISEELRVCIDLFDIYISINHECSLEDIQKIVSLYPQANIFMFENRGRDVLPFLKIFRKIQSLHYKTLCKIHTKKSTHMSSGKEWGTTLRSRLFSNYKTIIDNLENNQKTGAYVAKDNIAHSREIGLNRENIKTTCSLLDIQYTDDFSFPKGTMFWCKTEAIAQLASQKLESKYFVIENGEIDGTFAHAIERLVGLLIQENGYKILEI